MPLMVINWRFISTDMPKLLIAVTAIFLPLSSLFAQSTPEQNIRTEELQAKDAALIKKIEKKKEEPKIEEETQAPAALPASTQKVLVKVIKVTGAALVSQGPIDAITRKFENQRLSIKEMNQIADRVTDLYRGKGYITSRAYLPPQKIDKGELEIRVIEGRTGNIEVRGNRFFKTKFLLSRINMPKGRPFNYNVLRLDMAKVNENPDIFSRAALTPGKEPGQTDILMEVKDKLPVHAGFDWDNYGSRYIGADRYNFKFTDNNLLGSGDVLNFQYQMAQAGRYFAKNIRYQFPFSRGFKVGASANLSRVKLGREYKDLDVRGKSQVYSLFASGRMVDKEGFDLSVNLGFDYKNMVNYQQGAVTSHDRLRIVRAGYDIDSSDRFGRTLLTHEFDFGIPDIMGGMKAKDYNASRTGAGGKFLKNTLNLLRTINLPLTTSLLWKNQIQLSPYVLTSAEQFQIGGIANVRGYPPAEAVGDSGYAMTFEWSLPVYFIPRNVKAPFSQARFYDAARVALFWDWGNTRLRRPLTGEKKNRTLRSAGFGFRFNLPVDFTFRLDCAWPLDKQSSDGNHLQTWVMLSKNF